MTASLYLNEKIVLSKNFLYSSSYKKILSSIASSNLAVKPVNLKYFYPQQISLSKRSLIFDPSNNPKNIADSDLVSFEIEPKAFLINLKDKCGDRARAILSFYQRLGLFRKFARQLNNPVLNKTINQLYSIPKMPFFEKDSPLFLKGERSALYHDISFLVKNIFHSNFFSSFPQQETEKLTNSFADLDIACKRLKDMEALLSYANALLLRYGNSPQEEKTINRVKDKSSNVTKQCNKERRLDGLHVFLTVGADNVMTISLEVISHANFPEVVFLSPKSLNLGVFDLDSLLLTSYNEKKKLISIANRFTAAFSFLDFNHLLSLPTDTIQAHQKNNNSGMERDFDTYKSFFYILKPGDGPSALSLE